LAIQLYPVTGRNTEENSRKTTQELPNVRPGEILLKDFLEPMGISQNRLARDISVPPRRINEIVLGKRAITSDTALRLARYFGTSERFWLGLQVDFDLEEARKALSDRLEREVRPLASAA
jgi:antitoxin HigA-1